MLFAPKTIPLKDGRTAILRSPDPDRDAAELVQYLYDTAADTPYVLRTPDEITMTVEGEIRFLEAVVDSDYDCMILCEVDGRIAGNCHLSFMGKKKIRHRCSVAIALRKEFWAQGIGTAMFEAMIGIAEAREGVTVMELEYIEGNARARALYEKMGFRLVGIHPDAIRQEDGTLLALHLMQRPV